VLPDLSAVRTWPEFASCLSLIRLQTGKSLKDLEAASVRLAKRDGRFRELKRSTVSSALNGTTRINKQLLESLLAALSVAEPERSRVMEAWIRVSSGPARGPTNSGRCDEASPRQLGIHATITADDATNELTSYVKRDFDVRLQDVIAKGVDAGCFVVLMGGSSTGKTRSLYEAVMNVVPDWWLVQPTRTRDIVDLVEAPIDKIVLWLDDLHRFLGGEPALTNDMVTRLVRKRTIVVGTLWPEEYHARKTLRCTDGPDTHADGRRLLESADVVSVPDGFTEKEHEAAADLALTDSRLRAAIAVSDAGITQVLAAGPDLVHRWEQAPDPYTKAVITAAADARRLGVQGPLSEEALTAAMAGYLTPTQRVAPPDTWLERALRHATAPLNGAVSALTPVAGPQAGVSAGFVVADYLVQHIRRVQRTACPPESLWTALTDFVEFPDDLRRLAAAAIARLRYRYAELALRRLMNTDGRASEDLATLLVRRDRIAEAITLLGQPNAQTDRGRTTRRAELADLQSRAEALSEAATHDELARARYAELLADAGHTDRVRTRVAAGDINAIDQLADLLAERGCLGELRELAATGSVLADERLADLLAPQRPLDLTDEPNQHWGTSEDHAAHLREWQGAADAGDEAAAVLLTDHLFDVRDEHGLLAEVNAGTHQAAQRYLAVLTAESGVESPAVWQIRALGLMADGTVRDPEAMP
jgi:hypothetical protein